VAKFLLNPFSELNPASSGAFFANLVRTISDVHLSNDNKL